MINTKLLKEIFQESGMSVQELSIRTGVLEKRVLDILAGDAEPNAPEIQALSTVLNMPDRKRRMVFFNRNL